MSFDSSDDVERMVADPELAKLARQMFEKMNSHRYSYHFTWMGRPIIQYPQDVIALQEIIWSIRPELIIETGIAHGGSTVFYASMLELVGGEGKVVGIDVEIRPHNKAAIDAHPMRRRIEMIQGSSVDDAVAAAVSRRSKGRRPIMVVLDSNHTHEHVLRELQLYGPLVTPGSYLVVMDTVVERLPKGTTQDRPWDKGNNPMTALNAYLSQTDRFVIEKGIEEKLLITVAPSGYLRCVKD